MTLICFTNSPLAVLNSVRVRTIQRRAALHFHLLLALLDTLFDIVKHRGNGANVAWRSCVTTPIQVGNVVDAREICTQKVHKEDI
jgi:hypothetical protein